jgi:hypothetical protein
MVKRSRSARKGTNSSLYPNRLGGCYINTLGGDRIIEIGIPISSESLSQQAFME